MTPRPRTIIAITALSILLLSTAALLGCYRKPPEFPLPTAFEPCECSELPINRVDAKAIAASHNTSLLQVHCFKVKPGRDSGLEYWKNLPLQGWLPFYVEHYSVGSWGVNAHGKGRYIVYFAGRISEGNPIRRVAVIYGVRSVVEYLRSELSHHF